MPAARNTHIDTYWIVKEVGLEQYQPTQTRPRTRRRSEVPHSMGGLGEAPAAIPDAMNGEASRPGKTPAAGDTHINTY